MAAAHEFFLATTQNPCAVTMVAKHQISIVAMAAKQNPCEAAMATMQYPCVGSR